MNKGKVYWITGLSNSGKTTIGTALYYDLKKETDSVVILDGDMMLEIVNSGETELFTREKRLIRAKRYSLLSKLLVEQGITVIVCTLSMFHEIRKWNREHIPGYIEVFLDVPEDIRAQRGREDLHTADSRSSEQQDMTEQPSTPDLVIHNDGSVPIETFVKEIKQLKPSMDDQYDRDRQYWNTYYSENADIRLIPSDFAQSIAKEMQAGQHVLELGCGNGRDSLFFLSRGMHVTAIDASDFAIEQLNRKTANDRKAMFICGDFVRNNTLYQMRYDIIYSRFTLHAIDDLQETELLKNIRQALVQNGRLCIEARTIHDELYGKGTRVGPNSFIYNNHFRRFIDPDAFRKKLESAGYQVLFMEEGAGFSKTETSDPVLMRCIATR